MQGRRDIPLSAGGRAEVEAWRLRAGADVSRVDNGAVVLEPACGAPSRPRRSCRVTRRSASPR